ncbi:hypothetical protein Tco_0641702 [Tanacetum coccineum]
MITTSSKMEGRKPSGLMETVDIMDLIPCVGSVHCITQDLALSGVRIVVHDTEPEINQDTHFELKWQFLKELHDNTFSGSEQEDANEHIEKEVILFYNGLDVPTRQILDSKGAIPSKTAFDAKTTIQEMAEYSQKWHNGTSSRTRSTKTSDGLAVIQAQLNNLGREIKKVNEKVYAAQSSKARILSTQQWKLFVPCSKRYYGRLSKFIVESAKRHEENSNIIKEIRASTDAAIRN